MSKWTKHDTLEWFKIVCMAVGLVGAVLIVKYFDPHAFESNEHRQAVALEKIASESRPK